MQEILEAAIKLGAIGVLGAALIAVLWGIHKYINKRDSRDYEERKNHHDRIERMAEECHDTQKESQKEFLAALHKAGEQHAEVLSKERIAFANSLQLTMGSLNQIKDTLVANTQATRDQTQAILTHLSDKK